MVAMSLSFSIEQNLEQIKSLKHTRLETDYNQNLLNKRRNIALRDARAFRRMAEKNPKSSVAQYYIGLAEQIESKIK